MTYWLAQARLPCSVQDAVDEHKSTTTSLFVTCFTHAVLKRRKTLPNEALGRASAVAPASLSNKYAAQRRLALRRLDETWSNDPLSMSCKLERAPKSWRPEPTQGHASCRAVLHGSSPKNAFAVCLVH